MVGSFRSLCGYMYDTVLNACQLLESFLDMNKVIARCVWICAITPRIAGTYNNEMDGYNWSQSIRYLCVVTRIFVVI